MDNLISVFETETALDALKLIKSPWLDGFTAEIYRTFKHQLSSKLQHIFKARLAKEKVPLKWWEAKIVLIPQIRKDLSKPDVIQYNQL